MYVCILIIIRIKGEKGKNKSRLMADRKEQDGRLVDYPIKQQADD